VTGVLAGCQVFGPSAIKNGRAEYNKIIQTTSIQQVFMNVVRAHRDEPMLFMDVTEVDAQLTASAQLQAGASYAGGHDTGYPRNTSSVQGTVEYQEQPTIRYAPLQGQPLIIQLSSPIGVEHLANASDSSWPLASLLTFTVNYITPNYLDTYSVLNALFKLYDSGAIALVAAKSGMTNWRGEDSEGGSEPGQSTQSGADSLLVYLEPENMLAKNATFLVQKRKETLHLWVRLIRFYIRFPQPAFSVDPEMTRSAELYQRCIMGRSSWNDSELATLDQQVDALTEEEVGTYLGCLPNWIELRTVPIPANAQGQRSRALTAQRSPLTSQDGAPAQSRPADPEPQQTASRLRFVGAPLLRTRSAGGVMRTAARDSHLIEFLDRKRYDVIQERERNCSASTFYTLVLGELKGSLEQLEEELQTDKQIIQEVSDWARAHCSTSDLLTYYRSEDVADYSQLQHERTLAHLRRFLLVIEDKDAPRDSFVSYQHDGRWYYIDAKDDVSKKNFVLLSYILSVMAAPSQTPPLTPTITVGGRGG
jgi:hypothetical protein